MARDADNDGALEPPQDGPKTAVEQPEPEYTGTDLHPDQVEDYQPRFDRLGTARRVLGHVTDEVDVDALGPRNTLAAISHGLLTDANTREISNMSPELAAAETQGHLDKLVEAGLLVRRGDESYELTDDGLIELRN